jgi:hypothetical protein
MIPTDKPIKVQRVRCQVCHKEIPKSEAIVPEATDYLLYFCGFDCYEKWKNRG